MFRYPDNPRLISTDYLADLDKDYEGKWIAQPKLDGWRRIIWREDGVWNYHAKGGSANAGKRLPEDLQAEFEALNWPQNIGLDCEWVGPRVAAHVQGHSLHVFDILMCPCEILQTRDYERVVSFSVRNPQYKPSVDVAPKDANWMGQLPFSRRYHLLESLMTTNGCQSEHVKLVPAWENPGPCRPLGKDKYPHPKLMDLFLMQMQDPMSEGLVIRAAESRMIGAVGAPADNPMWFKIRYRK